MLLRATILSDKVAGGASIERVIKTARSQGIPEIRTPREDFSKAVARIVGAKPKFQVIFASLSWKSPIAQALHDQFSHLQIPA